MKKVVFLLVVVIISLGMSMYLFPLPNRSLKEVTNNPIPSPTYSPSPTKVPLNAFRIFNLVNNYRIQNGLKALSWNPSMCPVSDERAKESSIDWSHNGVWTAFSRNNVHYVYAAENLANGYDSDEETVQNWIDSPEHKKDMLGIHYTDTCVSVYQDSFVAQEFASF